MILAIWPSFGTKPSLTKEIAMGGTVNYLIGFILFWAGSLPFIWFPVHKVRHLFTVKAVVAPTAGIAFLIWALVRAGGAGEIIHQPAKVHGNKPHGPSSPASCLPSRTLPLSSSTTPISLVSLASQATLYFPNSSPSLLDSALLH
jgi:cytosine/uracil/thiamine/allantoin permease